jgi:ABC-type multidrug transport system fused ATPase/permease subunit
MTEAIPAATLPDLMVRLWRHLSSRRRLQIRFYIGLMLVSALAEVVSMGSILPFLGILIAPESVFSNNIAADFAVAWGISSANQLVLPLTVAFIMAALMAGTLRILVLWVGTRLAYICGADLSIEMYRRTLYQPYHVHLARNSSEVISGIINKVGGAVNVLYSFLTLISSALLMVAIMLTLIAINPVVATVAFAGFGASYGLITWMTRRRLHRNGERIAYEQTQVVKALQEGLGGIRDVLLDGTQPVYCDIYRQADYPLRRAQGNNAFIGGSPRYALEALGMVLIAALAFVLSLQVGGILTALPVLGALALGAQRLLPALQQIYSAWATIAGSHASLADAIQMLDQPLPNVLMEPNPAPLLVQKAISFNAVRFRYTSEGPWVLDDLNLTISKGTRVGIIGSTGSGKSTVLDLLMGLLIPTEGELLVDGRPLSPYLLRAWQRNIAHVPQNIYLADTTLTENIAFGVPLGSIDLDRVRQVSRQAQIADFIESRPEGYNAFVGERGVRLSGGQRQRIGIARALYKNANVLVFDEATSALDNATEQSVMEAIEALSSDLTILLIAHRLTTVRRCDTIIELAYGRVVAQGTYEQLLECSPSFRRMATVI